MKAVTLIHFGDDKYRVRLAVQFVFRKNENLSLKMMGNQLAFFLELAKISNSS